MLKTVKEVNLGKILRGAALRSVVQLSKALPEQARTGFRRLEILTTKRGLSRQRLIDLLADEIPFPFGAKGADTLVNDVLCETGMTTETEFQ